ncbi:MAG: hypothetical protein JJ974_07645 [Phycisphaerales bacterium]|nr:hypothetical protein [Phycisphaerales bacterium]
MSTTTILHVIALTLITLTSKSLAQTFAADHPVFGTNSVTVDPSQNLVFLDLTVTDDVSFADMPALLEFGATYDGWRYATQEEIIGLLNAIGWSPPITDLSTFNLSTSSIAETVLESFLGVITDDSTPPSEVLIASAGYLADGNGVLVTYVDSFGIQISSAVYRDVSKQPATGHWLVRDLSIDAPTYQGTLAEFGEPVDASADFQVTLLSSVGAPLATIEHTEIIVSQGLFSFPLSFNPALFEESGASLQIQVRVPSGSGAYERILPDQPVTPSPRALFADRAGHADRADFADQATIASIALVADELSGSESIPIPIAAELQATNTFGFQTPIATKHGRMVTLNGFITNFDDVSITHIATLPPGYRPSARISVVVHGGSDLGLIFRSLQVNPDGSVITNTGSFRTIFLEGITFPAAP